MMPSSPIIPPPSPSQNARVKRHHKKVYSGCWTCRAKHIKCDEAKPSCLRCERSGITCQGYGVRLSWTSSQGPSSFRSPRRSTAASSAGRSEAVLSSGSSQNEPTSQQRNNDDDSRNSPPSLSVSASHSQDPATRDPLPDAHAAASRPHSPRSFVNETGQRNNHGQASSSAWRTTHQNVIAEEPVSNTQTERPLGGLTPQLLSPDNNEDAYRDISWLPTRQQPSSPPSNSTQPRSSLPGTARQGCRHLDTLSDHASRCRILEHWELRVCDALNPVPGIYNPVRTIFTPLALEGAREDASVSTGAVALFHLICSAAAFHLSKSEEAPETRNKFDRMGIEHQNLGILHLSQNIQSDNECQYVSILASLIMCLLNEPITVYHPFWRLHIQGAVEWVNHVGLDYWYQTEEASTIYQMFTCMGIMIQSQILPGDRSGYGWNLRFNVETQPGAYVIDSIFGVPKPILEVMHRMNCIQQREQGLDGISAIQEAGEYVKELDALELELLLMVPAMPKLCPQFGQLIFHIGYAYYYGSLLYLKRTLKEVPVQNVQGLVKQALHHLESLQSIDDGPSTPSLWPIANIAFEAQDPELQHRMLMCLEVFGKQSTLEVYDKFACSVRELWRRRKNPGEENLSWHAYSPVFYHNYIFI